MAVFVGNTVCLLSPAKFGATTATVLDKLLAPGVRVGVSPPKIDPLGDYTERLVGLIDRLRPGSGTAMQSRAVILDTPSGGATQAVRRRRRRDPGWACGRQHGLLLGSALCSPAAGRDLDPISARASDRP